MLDAADITLPSGYVFKELLDETLDSINVLASNTKNDKFSIRIFPNDKSPSSENIINTIKKWNDYFRPKSSELQYNRILIFDTESTSENFYCIHRFLSRTLEFLCFYGDAVFEDEKHAICLQLMDLLKTINGNDNNKVLLPIFPSRLILRDDLYVQLTDLYPPNPIDEEAFLMGWFQPNATNESLIVRVIALLWKENDQQARERLNEYMTETGRCPKWSREFLLLHVSDTSTIRNSSIPPILALDLVRSKVNSGVRTPDHFAAFYGITEMIFLVKKLENQKEVIIKRVMPITLDLLEVDHDLLRAFILLLVLQILETVGFETTTDRLDKRKLDLPTFMMFVKKNLVPKYCVAQYTVFCTFPKIIKFIGPDAGQKLIVNLISIIRSDRYDYEKQVFCLNFTNIMISLSKFSKNNLSAIKPFICQLLSIKLGHLNIQTQDKILDSTSSKEVDDFFFKPSDQLLQSLICMPPDMYNVDAVVERMPSQCMTQTQFRYLIKICKHASPSMLYKFNVMAVLPLAYLSSLSQTFIKKLKMHSHATDYNVLVPPSAESYFLLIPSSATPIDDSMLENIYPFITKKAFEYTPAAKKPLLVNKAFQGVNSILELGPLKDFTFTLDGKGILVCSENSVRRYNSNVSSLDYTVLFSTTNESIEKVVAFPESFVITGSEGPLKFGLMQFYYDNKARSQSQSFDYPITALSRFESNDYVFFGLKNGDVYFNTPLNQKGSNLLVNIGNRLGAPISIVEMPNSPNYVISTDEGNTIIYDMRVRTPLKKFRATNRPAYVVPYDSNTFWMTCGPFCTKFDIKTLTMRQSVACGSSHIVGCCCVNDWIVTAHTDLSMFAINEKNVVNMNAPNTPLSFRRQGQVIRINPGDSVPIHEHPINCIRTSPIYQTAVTTDISGRMIMWTTPVGKKK